MTAFYLHTPKSVVMEVVSPRVWSRLKPMGRGQPKPIEHFWGQRGPSLSLLNLFFRVWLRLKPYIKILKKRRELLEHQQQQQPSSSSSATAADIHFFSLRNTSGEARTAKSQFFFAKKF
jgi:hypothetical protein